jgi:hypothetical protein
MRPSNAYKDMLDNVISPITCVSMNHQNQLKQITNGAIFATNRSILYYNITILPKSFTHLVSRSHLL